MPIRASFLYSKPRGTLPKYCLSSVVPVAGFAQNIRLVLMGRCWQESVVVWFVLSTSRRLRWAEHVVCMGDDFGQLLWVTVIWLVCIHSYHHRMSHHKILVLEFKRMGPLEDLGVDGRIC